MVRNKIFLIFLFITHSSLAASSLPECMHYNPTMEELIQDITYLVNSPNTYRSFNNNPAKRAIISVIDLFRYFQCRGLPTLQELRRRNKLLFTQLIELVLSPRLAAAFEAVLVQYEEQVPNDLLNSTIDAYLVTLFTLPQDYLLAVLTPPGQPTDPYLGFATEGALPTDITQEILSVSQLDALSGNFCAEAKIKLPWNP